MVREHMHLFDVSEEPPNNFKSEFAKEIAFEINGVKSYSKNDKNEKQPILQMENGVTPAFHNQATTEVIRRRKVTSPDINRSRRLSCYSSMASSSDRRTSICSSRLSDMPLQCLFCNTSIHTLQWQLKEVQESRDMYKNVLKQVVVFLERAHRSLEALGSQSKEKSVSRSRSEHQINDNSLLSTSGSVHSDYTLRRHHTKHYQDPNIVALDKLSTDTVFLLNTARQVLNFPETCLSAITANHSTTSTTPEPVDELEFHEQLAKEFPPHSSDNREPQRTSSFSFSPKLLVRPDPAPKICQAFNRKLSLQPHEIHSRSMRPTGSVKSTTMDSVTTTFGGGDTSPPTSSMISSTMQREKTGSTPASSISSVEDESGFSSMTSFQEVGLPTVVTTTTSPSSTLASNRFGHETTTSRAALLHSMLDLMPHHQAEDYSFDNKAVDTSKRDICQSQQTVREGVLDLTKNVVLLATKPISPNVTWV